MQASETFIDPEEVLVLLGSLVERSLITFDEISNRYSMLETVRHYSRERLLDTGEGPGLRAKHAANCLELLRGVNQITDINEGIRVMKVTSAELDNIRAAAMHMIATEDIATTTMIVRSLGSYWLSQGNTEEPIALLTMALEPHMNGPLDRVQADALLEKCSFEFPRDPSARKHAVRAMAEWERLGGFKEIAECNRLLGNIAMAEGKIEDAEKHYQKALQGAEGADLIARIQSGLATVAIMRKDWEEARRCLESITSEVLGIRIGAMVNLVWIDIKQEKLDGAKGRLLGFGEIVIESSAPIAFPTFAELAAEYFAALGNWRLVPTLVSFATRMHEEMNVPISGFQSRILEGLISQSRMELGAEADVLWEQGDRSDPLVLVGETMDAIRGS